MSETPRQRLAAFIQAVPKTETHLHFEGALPYDELLRPFDPGRYPENPEFRRSSYRYSDFPDFERILLKHAVPWCTSVERYHEAARVIFAGHLRQNVRYVETSFHLPVAPMIGVPPAEIARAIRSAAPLGLEVRVFAGMLRNSYAGELIPLIDALADCDAIDGIDLHGFEQMPTEPWSERLWATVRQAGKVTKCHAGEFDGAHRVREAIERLGVRRVQHGIRAVEDPAVLALAKAKGAVFDVCPLSNVGLQVVPDLSSHPLRRILASGVSCTISTDDPLCFGNCLHDEYLALADEAGFTAGELASLARNGWRVADSASRNARIAEIDRLEAEFNSPPP